MNAEAQGAYVRATPVAAMPPPISDRGPVGWVRAHLLSSKLNVVLTLLSLIPTLIDQLTELIAATPALAVESEHLLRELLRKEWVIALLFGAAYGGGMGLLRDRQVIISLFQRVAMIVLRVLAPVLAV